MLRGTYISLGIGDTDWEIDTALHKCGGEPKPDTVIWHISTSTARRKWKQRNMKGSRKRTNDKGAAERSLFSFINDMYGKQNPAVHR